MDHLINQQGGEFFVVKSYARMVTLFNRVTSNGRLVIKLQCGQRVHEHMLCLHELCIQPLLILVGACFLKLSITHQLVVLNPLLNNNAVSRL